MPDGDPRPAGEPTSAPGSAQDALKRLWDREQELHKAALVFGEAEAAMTAMTAATRAALDGVRTDVRAQVAAVADLRSELARLDGQLANVLDRQRSLTAVLQAQGAKSAVAARAALVVASLAFVAAALAFLR